MLLDYRCAQQFGILCLTVCVIQLLGLISFDVT